MKNEYLYCYNYYNKDEVLLIEYNDIICMTKWYHYWGMPELCLYTKRGKFLVRDVYEFNEQNLTGRYIPLIQVSHFKDM